MIAHLAVEPALATSWLHLVLLTPCAVVTAALVVALCRASAKETRP